MLVQGSRFTVGGPFDPGTRVGQLVSHMQLDAVRSFTERAERDGARLIAGSAHAVTGTSGFCLARTVFANAALDSDLAGKRCSVRCWQ